MEWIGKEFAEGLWYTIEQLVVYHNNTYLAEEVLLSSGINEWEFRQILKETAFHVEELTVFLDNVFCKEEV